MNDLAIAQAAQMKPIVPLMKEKLGVPQEFLEPYGHYKAKISLDYADQLSGRPDGKLILVTAISPTPAGEGKTTATIGLVDALNRLGKKTVACLREPSLGPCFGLKGGAAGGGYAQVVPMEDINLHFTGDFHAIGLANNLLSAMVDNHIHHGNELEIDQRRVVWKRVVDMNDRALREITVALGGLGNGFPRTDGFNIVVASEVMAIFCLATSLKELRERLGNIVVGYRRDRSPVTARDLKAHGAMTVLLKNAFQPNAVQTLEGNIALIHGGPFANIAHGCNSVIATKLGLKLADFVVTEAGFGADLGAEKFLNIKCRKSGLRPDAAVVVATIRALKYHGGAALGDLTKEDLGALDKGIENLERHVRNVRDHYGLSSVIAINRYTADTDSEIELLRDRLAPLQVPVVLAEHWEKGGAGAEDLAREVLAVMERPKPDLHFIYPDEMSLWEKMETLAKKIYGAGEVVADPQVHAELKRLEKMGYGLFPLCVAKTPFSFSADPKLLGAPCDHVVRVREVRLAAGAEFIIMICGDILTMPGLPKDPAATRIDLDENGTVVGLF